MRHQDDSWKGKFKSSGPPRKRLPPVGECLHGRGLIDTSCHRGSAGEPGAERAAYVLQRRDAPSPGPRGSACKRAHIVGHQAGLQRRVKVSE